jgi:hypothetical protein
MIMFTTPANLNPKGYQRFDDMAAAVSLTVPVGASLAFLQAEGANVRWRDDGVNPTASVGNLLIAGAPATAYTGDLSALRFVEVGTNAVLNVNFYASSGS